MSNCSSGIGKCKYRSLTVNDAKLTSDTWVSCDSGDGYCVNVDCSFVGYRIWVVSTIWHNIVPLHVERSGPRVDIGENVNCSIDINIVGSWNSNVGNTVVVSIEAGCVVVGADTDVGCAFNLNHFGYTCDFYVVGNAVND